MKRETGSGRAMRILVVVGGGALLLAMATDAIAVLGRHSGFPLLGSIEIVQASVVIAAIAAMVVASVARTHATVHLVTDRASPRLRRWLVGIGQALGALLFVGLLIGSGWIAADLWNAHEESEVIGIPYRPLRLLVLSGCAALVVIFLVQAVRRERT
ncbi:TRAP transporter small permease [Sphingosinicella sp. CPCC 101087]|uniref:TRAP transporter small permease n=1 Tax=Sphingosinicella sp. CPCC 101087 TaxID=2497754 RepID=UPI00101D1179|nr:TRAP transporter small permease subunit [Sphingosinicella sp. CPCC 101087]